MSQQRFMGSEERSREIREGRRENDCLPKDCDIALGGANVRLNEPECICNQPTATGDMDDITSPLSRSSSCLSLHPPSSSSDTHTSPLHQPHHHRPHPPSPGKHLFSTSPTPPRTESSPFRPDGAYIKEVAGDDLCLRCVLSCLYCKLVSMCSTVELCLTCPGTVCCCKAICCCCSGEAGGMACGQKACQALVDCGIVEDCCSSTDLLDFSLECCSFFFPS